MTTDTAINAEKMKTDALQSFDRFMIDATIRVDHQSDLAFVVWSDVLKELDRRGKVRLISGSYDDIGNSLIHRP